MEIDFCVKNYLENYNLLIEQLTFLFKEDEFKEYIIVLNNESKDKKWLRGVRFQQQISNELFDTFLESKIKLFSHKDENTKNISESLFGTELSLKKIFNNRDDNTKFILWAYLHLMVLMVELTHKKNKDRIKKLSKLIEENNQLLEKAKIKAVQQNNVKDPKSMLKDIFNVDVNDETNDMLNDIVKSFESSLSNEKGNPLTGIFDISQKISSKYQQKINTGEIQLNKLMEGIQKNIPGMDELMKNGLDGIMGGKQATKPKETVIIDENFSTANVELGKQNETKKGFNIGKMLSMANSFGVLGGDNIFGGNNPLGGDNPIDKNMSELFGMISSMGNLDNKDNIENLKNKMDEFLSKQGIDITKLNSEIDTMMQQGKEEKKEEVKEKEEDEKDEEDEKVDKVEKVEKEDEEKDKEDEKVEKDEDEDEEEEDEDDEDEDKEEEEEEEEEKEEEKDKEEEKEEEEYKEEEEKEEKKAEK